jgi:hypothetical protein
MFFQKKNNTLYLIAFALFILSACFGLLIRWNFVFPINGFVYKNFIQSHSHVAFLGWGYLAIIGAIIINFLSKNQQQHKIYKISLSIIISTIALMLISFPLAGYKVFSIVLLSVFGITSYVLSFKLLVDLKGKSISIKLIKYGIYYYLLSSLATWFLAGVIVTQGKTELYYNTVYFYLHFLYNGFLVFAIFGLLFKIFENQQIIISQKLQKQFFIFLNIACIPAYLLSVLWSEVPSIFYIIGFLAAVLQLISLIFLLKIVKHALLQLKWNSISKLLLMFGLTAYSLKIIAQLLSAFPYFVEKALALKPFFIIGYLHLFTLGFMSVFIILLLNKSNKIQLVTITSKIGLITYLLGVLLTEFLLFFQGFLLIINFKSIANYQILMLIFSLFMIAGLLLIYVSQFKSVTKEIA